MKPMKVGVPPKPMEDVKIYFCWQLRLYLQKQPQEVFYKIRYLAKFTGNHLCWSLFLIKFQTFKEHLRTTASVYVKIKNEFSMTSVIWGGTLQTDHEYSTLKRHGNGRFTVKYTKFVCRVKTFVLNIILLLSFSMKKL